MTDPLPASPAPSERAADWEAFYRDYRKPGYVSGFEITTKLGGGMSGLVFRARKQSIGKDYAIKFLQVDDGEVRRAVLLELEQVQYFAQIDHPNLVSIEDRGEVDGIPFLVMSFAGTETLRDRIHTDGTPPTGAERDELLRYFLQCCRGLVALHERSLVHFDIKPANVFLKGAVARLGDYGLSKLVTHSRGSLSMGRGTPYYMAPELLQRRGDHRSDIYSLGVMLYEILCGKVPFTGDSEWEVLRRHETAAPELPAHLSALERGVLLRCLAKDPTQRYQSVHDLIAAFGAEAGVGAAAWSDVRAGATGAAPSPAPAFGPPPLPVVPPPPLRPATVDQLKRDARQYAEYVAAQALHGVRRVAQATVGTVRDTLGELRQDGRGRGIRHRRALAKVRARMHWPRRVPRPRVPAAGRVASVVRGLAITVAIVFGFVFVAFLMLTPGHMAVTEAPAMPTVSAPVRLVDTSRTTTFRYFGVPSAFHDLVSTSEPDWVALALVDRAAAATTLQRHLDQLRERVPFQPEARAVATDLPAFGSAHELPVTEQAEFDDVLHHVLHDAEPDPERAQQLVRLGPAALAATAQRLARVPYRDRADVEQARRLHAALEAATGCREMEFVDEGALDAIARADRPVGTLWLWFLNEVAHNERTWQTYRSLRGAR